MVISFSLPNKYFLTLYCYYIFVALFFILVPFSLLHLCPITYLSDVHTTILTKYVEEQHGSPTYMIGRCDLR